MNVSIAARITILSYSPKFPGTSCRCSVKYSIHDGGWCCCGCGVLSPSFRDHLCPELEKRVDYGDYEVKGTSIRAMKGPNKYY